MALPMSLQQLSSIPEGGREPDHWRWTIDAYFRAGEAGLFDQYRKVELIDGEIYIHMSPAGTRHSAGVGMLYTALDTVFGAAYMFRTQQPILRPDDSMPEPDISVVRYQSDYYASRHPMPADIVLVAEVSDSSLSFDRHTKATHYGKAGIAEYWILNLVDNQLEVYRKPDSEIGFREVVIYKKDEVIATLAVPDQTIRVADLIPSQVNI